MFTIFLHFESIISIRNYAQDINKTKYRSWHFLNTAAKHTITRLSRFNAIFLICSSIHSRAFIVFSLAKKVASILPNSVFNALLFRLNHCEQTLRPPAYKKIKLIKMNNNY